MVRTVARKRAEQLESPSGGDREMSSDSSCEATNGSEASLRWWLGSLASLLVQRRLVELPSGSVTRGLGMVPPSEAHEGDEPLQEGNRMRAATVASRSKPLENRWPGGSGSDCGGRAGHQVQEGQVAPETERPSRGGNPWRVSRTP